MAKPWLRKLLILPPILLGAGALAFMIANKKPPIQKPPAEQLRHVRVITAQKTDLIPFIRGFGAVSPATSWNALAQVSGQVVYVHPDFRQGAILPKGTEIIRISPKDYELAVKQAKANIRAADAKLTELEVSAQNTRAALAIERESLELKAKDFTRKEALAKRGTISAANLDNERRDLLGQRKRVLELENALRLIPVQADALKQSRAVSLAQLETAKLNLERTRIKLPFTARISRVSVAITQFAGVGQSLGQADSIKTAEIYVQIPQSHIQRFTRAISRDDKEYGISGGSLARWTKKHGLYAIVRLGSGGRKLEWKGKLSRISDLVDPKTRTIGAIVTVENSYGKAVPGMKPPLVKGMFVEVELRANALKDKILLPRSSVHEGKVFIRTDEGRLDIRKVKTGLIQGSLVVIDEGIKAGDEIVVSDLSPAIPGMRLDGVADKALMARIANEAKRGGAGE